MGSMALSDDEAYLQSLIEARTAIVTALANGVPVIEYYIGNRRVRKEATTQLLKDINELIREAASSVGAATGGRARSLIQKKRRG